MNTLTIKKTDGEFRGIVIGEGDVHRQTLAGPNPDEIEALARRRFGNDLTVVRDWPQPAPVVAGEPEAEPAPKKKAKS